MHARPDALSLHSLSQPLPVPRQVFKYFIMKPLPEKSRTGKALAMLKPKNWLTHPMLLVPMYKNASGCLLEAPVKTKYKGFKVSKPTDFVKKHPRMVQLGMLALKIGIKIAAAQLAVNLPTAALDELGPKTDGLINSMLTMSCESMKAHFEDDDKMDGMRGARHAPTRAPAHSRGFDPLVWQSSTRRWTACSPRPSTHPTTRPTRRSTS